MVNPEATPDPESLQLTPEDIVEIAEAEVPDSSYLASVTSFINGSIDRGGATIEQALQMIGLSVDEAKEQLAKMHQKPVETFQKNIDTTRQLGKGALSNFLKFFGK